MVDLATPDFLSALKAAYPPDTPNSPSYLSAVIAAVSFSASNIPEAVPLVFKYALDDLVRSQTQAGTPQDAAHQEQLVLARKVREGVLRAAPLCGLPRVSALLHGSKYYVASFIMRRIDVLDVLPRPLPSVARPFFFPISEALAVSMSDEVLRSPTRRLSNSELI